MNIFQLVTKRLFGNKMSTQKDFRPDLYNQAWHIWLNYFNGDLKHISSHIQKYHPAASTEEIQEVVERIWQELGFAMQQFYDVRDGEQTREQAMQTIKNNLFSMDDANLNALISRCQYSSER